MLREKAIKAEDALTVCEEEVETLQAQVADMKDDIDSVEAEITTHVRAKLMYQFMMGHSSSWDPNKEIDVLFRTLSIQFTYWEI